MKTVEMIKYDGNNQELFARQCVDNFSPETIIIVPDTHNAIIVKDGQMMTTLESGSHQIFDVKKGFFGLGKAQKTDVHTVDVIYMSKTYKLQIFWGTKTRFELRDPIADVPVKVGASGEFTIQICNPRKAYLELIGVSKNYTDQDLREYLSGQLLNEIEYAIASVMREKGLSYCQFSEYKKFIADSIFPALTKWCEESYGLKMFNFIISNVMFDEEDKVKVEEILTQRKQEEKDKAATEEERLRAKEIADEIERLDDKKFERQVLLKELQSKDYDKYLEVMKVLAEKDSSYLKVGKGKIDKKSEENFCVKCGKPYKKGDLFCSGCGAKIGGGQNVVCPKCKSANEPDAVFCSKCGEKLF